MDSAYAKLFFLNITNIDSYICFYVFFYNIRWWQCGHETKAAGSGPGVGDDISFKSGEEGQCGKEHMGSEM